MIHEETINTGLLDRFLASWVRHRSLFSAVLSFAMFATAANCKGKGTHCRVALDVFPYRSRVPSVVPIAFGLPFPRGLLGDPGRLDLRGPRGARLFFESEVVSRWPDRSVRWLRVDTQTRVGGVRSGSRLHLTIGSQSVVELGSSASKCFTEWTSTGLWLGSGSLRMFLSETEGSPFFSSLSIGARRILADPGFELEAELSGSKRRARFSRSPSRRIIVERTGPLRTVVRVDGQITEPEEGREVVGLSARIHVYAGLPYFRLELRFFPPVGARTIQNLSVRLRPRFKTGARAVVSPGKTPRPLALVPSQEERTLEYRPEVGRSRAAWAVWEAGGLRLVLVDPDFQWSPDRVLKVSKDGICLDLMPDPVDWPSGAVLVADLLLGVSEDARRSKGRGGIPDPEHLDLPAFALPGTRWLKSTGLFPLPQIRSTAGGGRRELAASCARSLDRDTTLCDSWVDVGDWRMGLRGFGNLEFDTVHGSLIQALMTQDPRWVQRARQSLHHLCAVDLLRDPEWSYLADEPFLAPSPHGPRHRGGPVELGHIWVEGALETALLLADERSVQDIRHIGDAVERLSRGDRVFARDRDLGWTLISLAALDRHLGEPRFRDALRSLAGRCATRRLACGLVRFGQEPPGPRGLSPEKLTIDISTWVASGVLIEGYVCAWQATGDDRYRTLFVDLGGFLCKQIIKARHSKEGRAQRRDGFPSRLRYDIEADAVVGWRGELSCENLLMLASGLATASRAGGCWSGVAPEARRAQEKGMRGCLELVREGPLTGSQASKILRSIARFGSSNR